MEKSATSNRKDFSHSASGSDTILWKAFSGELALQTRTHGVNVRFSPAFAIAASTSSARGCDWWAIMARSRSTDFWFDESN